MGELSEPPFRGIVESTQDALLLFEAARRGIIPRVSRRFTEKERSLIQSGAIFVFHEEESKIKRWTDGLVWSPSRILGNFLIYRELEKRDRSGKITSFSSGEAKYRPSSSSGPGGLTVKTGRPPSRSTASDTAGMLSPPISPATSLVSPSAPSFPGAPLAASSTGRGQSFALGAEELSVDASGPPAGDDGDLRPISQSSQLSTSGASGLVALTSDADDLTPAERRERKLRERQLVGSLTASFRFKEKGLIKKTMSMTINGYSQHLISYYSLEDALCGRLRSPSTLPELSSLEIGSEFLDPEQFRFPPKTQIGPDGLLRYRGEPDMQEDTPDELSTAKPQPAASTSTSRRRSSPPSFAATGSSSTAPAYGDVKPPRPGSASSRPLDSPSYLAGPSSVSYTDPSPIAPPPQSFPRRPSSPPTYAGAPSSGSYPSRSGRMYHPYATGATEYGDQGGGPRYTDGGRRPSLRGQYSFDGQLPESGRPPSASYSAGPPPMDLPTAAPGYALPPGYGPPAAPAAPYPPSPRSAGYPQMQAAYPVPSMYQPSPYDAYLPPQQQQQQQTPQPTYYGDSPGQSPIEGPPAGIPLSAQQLPPAHPYQHPPPAPAPHAGGYYHAAPRAAPDPYSPLYPPGDPSQPPPHRPYYPQYAPSVAPPQGADDGHGLFDAAFDEAQAANVYRTPLPDHHPQHQPQQLQHALAHHHHHPSHPPHPPPPGPDGQPPYAGWGYGD